jgi:hypothetical protein
MIRSKTTTVHAGAAHRSLVRIRRVTASVSRALAAVAALSTLGAATLAATLGSVVQQEDAYLKASNLDEVDAFGFSVAASGETVAVGVPGEDSDGSGPANDDLQASGAVYVLVRDGSRSWVEQAYLKAFNPDGFDFFGHSVALSGDTLVVGAPLEDGDGSGPGDNSQDNAGAAYVFARDGLGTWTQEAYLKASNNGASDGFGLAVAISGDTIVVGAPAEDSDGSGPANNGAMGAGAAYVFVRDAFGNWTEQAYLKASNADAGDLFGQAVAIAGDTVVVGARGESGDGSDPSNNGAPVAGAVYVFERDGLGGWSEQAYLKASNVEAGDLFGTAVAISGEVLVIGADRESSDGSNPTDNSAVRAGAAYVFERDGLGGWVEQAYLKASNAESEDAFGWSVAAAGGVVAVAATKERGGGTDPSDNSLVDAGAAYAFVRDGLGGWVERGYLKASSPGAQDSLGTSVAVLDDGTVVAGAPEEDGGGGDPTDNGTANAGAVYAFGPRFTVGGEVSGLVVGSALTLHNNGADDLTLDQSGSFVFPTPIADGSRYVVTVVFQPTGPSQTCGVANGSGVVTGRDIGDVQVSCAVDSFAVGGSVSGLVGSGLVLQNNGGDDLAIASDGPFTFATPLLDAGTYSVSILSQPTGPDQKCTITNGEGVLAGGDVTAVAVTCGAPGVADIPALDDAGATLLILLLVLAAVRATRRREGRIVHGSRPGA